MQCTKCKKEIDKLEAFPGNICIECYEKVFDSMTEEEKIPVFDKTLLN